ncbi:MAG: flavin reductase family protein [Saprospiraceae bacterium]|nr:flavin reductase family protein [Saprospiraceae bacterium]
MKRPWNLPVLAVYSLATYRNGQVNMNICTYVSAVSLQPKKYAVAIYENTQTLDFLKDSSLAILQLLAADQHALVRHLGKKSGFQLNKHNWLHKNNLLQKWQGMDVLRDCAALLLLEKENTMTTGDHILHLFNVLKYTGLRDDILTTRILGEKGIIKT